VHSARLTASLANRVETIPLGADAEFSDREHALARMVRFIAQLVDRLQFEVALEGLYDSIPSPEPGSAEYRKI